MAIRRKPLLALSALGGSLALVAGGSAIAGSSSERVTRASDGSLVDHGTGASVPPGGVVPGSERVPGSQEDPSGVVDPAVRDFAGVFRRAQRASDTERFAGGTVGSMRREFGAQFANSRRVATHLAGLKAWLVPADRRICILVLDTTDKRAAGPGGTCQPLSNLKDGGGSLTYHKDGQTTIIGVAPDGASGVELTLRDGYKRNVAAVDNAWATQVKGGTKSVRLLDGSAAAPQDAYDGSDE
jgi:hypothetical protein